MLCARQRVANQDAAAGSIEELKRIVKQIRKAWPKVKIMLRADSGFCRDELLSCCQQQRLDYVVGPARNPRLRAMIEHEMAQAAEQQQSGQPARVFAELEYQTLESWSRARRVVAKAGQLAGKQNPRYVVTSLEAASWPAQQLYEDLYCERGEAENRIKEQTEFVRRPHEQRDAAGQPTALVFVDAGACADGGAEAAGAAGDELGAGADGDDPAGTAEDRNTAEGERAAGGFIAVERLCV